MPDEALFAAIERGDLPAVEEMLGREPGLVEARTAEGLSPLLVAAYWGHAGVRDRLAALSGDLDLWESAVVGAIDRVRSLIGDDPDLVRAVSPDGFTALHLAVFFGHPDTARVLLDSGADVTIRTTNALANQPLHAAVAGADAGERPGCVRLLLAAGADANQRQSGGFTPLMGAAQNGDVTVTELLLSAGADPQPTDDDGLSAADHAARAGHAALALRLRPSS